MPRHRSIRGRLFRLSLASVFALGLALLCPSQAEPAGRPKSFTYVLQADGLGSRAAALKALADCGRDWMVLDECYSAPEGAWKHAELDRLRAAQPGRKILCYLSIGEAESYRGYWKKSWDANEDGRPDAGAPAFLEPVNPDWAGNYKVRYWQRAWQDLILAAIDRIAAAGFDGLYLDIIDGYEYFEGGLENKKNPETGHTYRQDMESWVTAVGQRARSRGASLIIPQNGSALLRSAAYRSLISGIGIEDLFSDGAKESSAAHRREVLGELARLDASKVRLVIDYARSSKLRSKVTEAAKAEDLLLLITDRELKSLGTAQKH